jgi:drug/metabolite transporter (DMT)-like permease
VFALCHWHVPHFSWQALGTIVYCALMATCVVFYLQTRYQHDVPVSRAAVIYAFEPLFATVIAAWLLHQPITLHLVWGGGLLLMGFAISCFNKDKCSRV